MGKGFIYVLVKNSGTGDRRSTNVTFSLGTLTPTVKVTVNGVATLAFDSYAGPYTVTVNSVDQLGYVVDDDDEGYHTFMY